MYEMSGALDASVLVQVKSLKGGLADGQDISEMMVPHKPLSALTAEE